MATITWRVTEQDGEDWTNTTEETEVLTREEIEGAIEAARVVKYGG